nr:MAG TPA: hypothetical protein [Caudoviricetes sp.]
MIVIIRIKGCILWIKSQLLYQLSYRPIFSFRTFYKIPLCNICGVIYLNKIYF